MRWSRALGGGIGRLGVPLRHCAEGPLVEFEHPGNAICHVDPPEIIIECEATGT